MTWYGKGKEVEGMEQAEKKLDNSLLLEAMAEFQQNPWLESEQNFATELLPCRLYILLAQGPKEEEGSVHLPSLQGSDGKPYLFGFTDQETGQNFCGSEAAYGMTIPFSQVADLLLNPRLSYGGFVLNPGSQQLLLPIDRVASYLGRPIPYYMEEGTKLRLGEPCPYPDEMVQAIREVADGVWEIKTLWFLLKMEEESGKKCFLIVVHKRDGDIRKIFDAIGKTAAAHIPEGIDVELISSDSELGKQAMTKVVPFYKRGLI